MRITIRSKLIIAISGLMVLLFVLAAQLFITEKQNEMAEDIYVNSLAFGKLTAPTITYDYDLYLAQNGFVYFNRAMKSIFDQNENLAAVKIVSYGGEILYDSKVDTGERYQGEKRGVDNEYLTDQISAENISVKTKDGLYVFLKYDADGKISYVDKNEKVLDRPMPAGTRLNYMVVPATEKYSVIYELTYQHLDERVALMTRRIIYLAVFGVMLGMLMSFVMSAKITKPIDQLVVSAGEIAKGNFKAQVDIKTSDELNFLGDAFNKMARDLEASLEAKLYKERVMSELKIAADIQQHLLPKVLPKVADLDIASGVIPAEEIGGDVYDFIKPSDDKLLFYLGDVTGHGVPAGIVSSIASALFYGYSIEPDLKKVISYVNRVLHAKTLANMFMTLCLMQWDSSAKKFSYVNAGHEQIIHYIAKEKRVELVPAGGIALGMLADISNNVQLREIDFQPGDYLVIYSDGIPESWKSKTEMYGMEKLQNAVRDFGNDFVTALAMKEAILSDVKQFVGDYKQMDDITLIVVKRVV
ncbi:MAG: SpoIIE family protein phosphatase [Candidatus Gracilibacteria bacterium]|jgi:serine phosphatase RsbU (regulator of sigma subunit)